MAIKVQNIQDYADYIKCGEILKSPLQNYKIPFVLKCFQCEDIHFLLESFIIHIQEHCKDVFTKEEPAPPRTRTSYKKEEEMESIEPFLTDSLFLKLQESNSTDMMDPLTGLSEVANNVDQTIKYEMEEMAVLDKSSNQEGDDDFGEVFNDSADEYHPSELESEVEEYETVGKTAKKRKASKETTSFIGKFMKSETNVTTLIAAYKNQSNLWNKDSPNYKNKEKRQKIFRELSENVNNKLQLELTGEQMAKIILHIRSKHRDAYFRLKKFGETGKKEQMRRTIWYYKHLEFLRGKEKIELQKLDAALPDLMPEQIIQILEIYKGFPHLWNSNLVEYVCSNKREDAQNEMLKMLESNMNLNITKNILEIYLNNIHTYFSVEKSTDVCNTAESSTYYKHMIYLFDHEGPFTCSVCDAVQTNPLLFKAHKSQHDGTIPFKCAVCNKELKTYTSYTTHAKRHFDDLEYKCNECDWRFYNQQELDTHILRHTGDRPFCCEICGTSYRHVHNLKKHLRRHENRFTHICNICSKGYYTMERYKDHMNSHMNIRSHICELCNKAFITKRALVQHRVVHEDARKFACKLCGATFKHKAGVNQHMKTHDIAKIEDKSNE